MDLDSILYIVYSTTSITVTIIMAFMFWLRRSGAGAKSMALMMSSAALWGLGTFLCDLSSSYSLKIFWDNLSYFGVVTVPVAWLNFTMQFTKYDGYLKRRKLFLLFVIPLITVLMVWTNGLHHLMISKIDFVTEGQMTVMYTTFGIWFWVHAAYSYSLFFFGTFLLVRNLVIMPKILRSQSIIILAAILVPLVLSILYAFKVDAVYPIDPTIFSFTLAGMLCFYAMFRYKLFELIPAARNAVIEGMSSILIVLDDENHIIDINSAAKKVFDIEEENLIGKYVFDVLGELSSYFKKYESVLKTEEKILIHTKDGREYYNLEITPLYDSKKKVVGKFVTLYDITALEEAIEGLEESRKAAEDANKAKSRFLAAMSHEIRTPLTGIIGMAELLSSANHTEEEKVYLQTVQSCSESLLSIINDILDFSKIEAGKMDVEKTDFNIRSLMDEVVKTFSHRTKEKEIALACSIGSGIPENLIGDPARIRQVLINLIGNAFKFTEKGRIDVVLEGLECENQQAAVQFSVIDSGIGVPEEKIDSIFKSFQQGDSSTNRKYGGTGLGLAIVKNLVSLMGGHIEVESKPGEGSRFSFTIPFKISYSQASKSALRPEINFDNKDITVLLAEDSPANQLLITKMLEKVKIKADIASNGREAVRMHQEKAYDLIFMDIQMPEMDGYEAAMAIRKNEEGTGNRIPIVALTANATEEDRKMSLQAGMDDYITKPLRSRKIYECLQRHTG